MCGLYGPVGASCEFAHLLCRVPQQDAALSEVHEDVRLPPYLVFLPGNEGFEQWEVSVPRTVVAQCEGAVCRVRGIRGELALARLHTRVLRRVVRVERVGDLVGEEEAPDTPQVGVATVALHTCQAVERGRGGRGSLMMLIEGQCWNLLTIYVACARANSPLKHGMVRKSV